MTESQKILNQDHENILRRHEALWDELQGARFFVTGGTGFIGTWMLESIQTLNRELGLGVRATVLTRDPKQFLAKHPSFDTDRAFSFVSGDVKDFAFPEGEFSHIIHAATAASAKLNLEAPFEMLDTIVEGTRRVTAFAAKCNCRVLLNTSSGGIYGKQPADMAKIPETYVGAPDPMEPWSCYGEAKRMSEFIGMVSSKASDFEHKVARITALVGPRLPLDIHFAMGNFIRDALRGQDIIIQGDGTPYRSYIYIADLVSWLWVILLKGQNNRPYNAGSDEAVSIRETAERVNKVCAGSGSLRVLQSPKPGEAPARYVPSIERARSELGLQVWTPLSEGILRTANWYRGQQTFSKL